MRALVLALCGFAMATSALVSRTARADEVFISVDEAKALATDPNTRFV